MSTEAKGRSPLERGATAVEYALLIALIAGTIIAAVITLGPLVADLYNDASQGW